MNQQQVVIKQTILDIQRNDNISDYDLYVAMSDIIKEMNQR